MNRWLLNICLLILFSSFTHSASFATEEYAYQTGRQCIECHVEAIGGGPLTKTGEEFLNDMKIKGLYRPLKKFQRVVRFFIGYLHILTAIAWFGTILYVHLILKPAYAAKGLPKGELTLGWGSIIIMAITGTLLTIATVPSWPMLFHTRFGVLLLVKICLFLIMVTTATVVTFIIGPRLKKKRQLNMKEHKQYLTIEELAQFDGKDGRPAYIAYKGDIYDVTKSKFWKDGTHLRKHQAGVDLTDALKTAPHGEEKILSLYSVGKLILPTEKPSRPFHERLFYFFAYMNLVLIFLIVFIIALWRWWL